MNQNLMAATDSGSAGAQIVTAITITNTTDLYFGSIQPAAGGDTITLDTADTATPTGASVITGSPTSGSFDVSGTESALYSVTLPGSATITSGANTMTVDQFGHNAGATPTIAVGGTSTLNIGARLTIANGQAEGVYTGTYSVTVDYQ
jgi:hypothetical protein